MDNELESLQVERDLRDLQAEKARRQSAAPQQSSEPPTQDQKFNEFKDVTSAGRTMSQDFAGGLLNNVKSLSDMLPSNYLGSKLGSVISNKLSSMLGSEQQDKAPMDAYQMMGTEDKPWNTPGGMAQVAGNLFTPGKVLMPGKTASETVSILADKIKNLPDLGQTAYEKMRPGKLAENIQKELGVKTDQVSANAQNQAEHIQQNAEQDINALHEDANKTAKSVAEDLHKGNQNTEQLAASVANDLRPIHDAGQANASSFYDYIFNAADRERAMGIKKNQQGRGLLYDPEANPLVSTAPKEGEAVLSQAKSGFGEVGKKFSDDPTPRNAHNFRQEVGIKAADIRSIPRPERTPEQNLQLQNYDSLYSQVTKDMENYFKNKHPNKNEDLFEPWKKGEQIWQEQVKPFLFDKRLRKIVRATKSGGGRQEFVPDIHKAFENAGAGDIRLPNGELQKGDASQLLDMMPQATKDKILSLQMGAPKGDTVQEMSKGLEKAENGYSNLIKPELKTAIGDALMKQQRAKELEALTKSHVSEIFGKSKGQIANMENEVAPQVERLKEKSKALTGLRNKALVYGGVPAALSALGSGIYNLLPRGE